MQFPALLLLLLLPPPPPIPPPRFKPLLSRCSLYRYTAASIRVVQMGEKVKLNMTCTLQVLKKSAAGLYEQVESS
jgi:hypothetical protein